MKNATPINLDRYNILNEYRNLVIREQLQNSRNDIQILVVVNLLGIYASIIGNLNLVIFGFFLASLLLVLFDAITGSLFNRLLIASIDKEMVDGESRGEAMKYLYWVFESIHLSTYLLTIIGISIFVWKAFIG